MQNPFAEHIIFSFPENIISRFDVAVNDVAEEFAEKLRLKMKQKCSNKIISPQLVLLYYNCTTTSASKFFGDNDLLIDLRFQFTNVGDNTDKTVTISKLLERGNCKAE